MWPYVGAVPSIDAAANMKYDAMVNSARSLELFKRAIVTCFEQPSFSEMVNRWLYKFDQ